MKIKSNKVFGYYIEVAKSQIDLVPDSWTRKQTTVNAERYISQELKELEHAIMSAQDTVTALEYQLFCQLKDQVCQQVAAIQASAAAVAQVDVLNSFATVAADNRYCMPQVDDSDALTITQGRHPVVEKVLKGVPFVPNDTHMDRGEDRCAIITGPNMAGKSTWYAPGGPHCPDGADGLLCSLPSRPTSAWWTGCSTHPKPATTWRRASPPLWRR